MDFSGENFFNKRKMMSHIFLCAFQSLIDMCYYFFQFFCGALFFCNNFFPVPLVHKKRMQVIGILISPDCVHICIQSFTGTKTITAQRIALPFCQRVYDFAVQIIIQTGFRRNKQRSRHAGQVQLFCQHPFKIVFYIFDADLGFPDGHLREVSLWNQKFLHNHCLLFAPVSVIYILCSASSR